MSVLKEARQKLADQLKTVDYIIKNCPNAKQDDEYEQFIDDSVRCNNADGFEWNILKNATAQVLIGVRAYKQLKRRGRKPIRVYGTKEYHLTPQHIELLLNTIDQSKVFSILERPFMCQENAR